MYLISIILLPIFITLANGEVDMCLKIDSHYVAQHSNISVLLAQINQPLNELILETQLIHFDDYHLNFSHPAITLEGNMTDGWIIMSSAPIWKYLSLVPEGIEIFNLTIPSIFLNGSYALGGYVGKNRLFDIYGNGDFFIDLINTSAAVVTSLNLNSSYVCLPITVKVFVEDCKSNFVHFMDGDIDLEPLLNGVIQDLIPDAIRIIFRELLDMADPYIQAIVNKIIHPNGKRAPNQVVFNTVRNEEFNLMT